MPHVRARLFVLLLAAALAGCTGSTSAPAPTPSASSSSASPTTTLSEGQQAANDTVIKYRALIDELRQQIKPDITRLTTLSRGDAYEKWRFTLQDDFVNGEHQVGTTSVSIISTDPGASTRQWIVTGCLDMSRADMIDKDGKSVTVTPAGKRTVAYTVEQDSTSLAWYVMSEQVDGPC